MGILQVILLTLLLCSSLAQAATTNSTSAAATTVLTTTAPPTVSTTTAPPSVSTTTAPPSVSTTTAPPSVSTTTAPPTVSTTTAPPSVSTTTAPPSVSTTTAPPSVSTTTAPPTVSTTTAPPSVSTTTGPSTVSTTTGPSTVSTTTGPSTVSTTTGPSTVSNTTGPSTTSITAAASTNANSGITATTPAITSTPKAICDANTCPPDSKCEELADEKSRCLCLNGLYWNSDSRTCEKGKVFLGDLTVKKPYNPEMSNKNSQSFKVTSEEIVTALKEVFKGKEGYLLSVVISLKPQDTPVRVLYNTPNVIAEVKNIFGSTSSATSTTVQDAIKESSGQQGVLEGATIKETDPCLDNPCNNLSTKCSSQEGILSCTCLEEFAVVDPEKEIQCGVCPSGKKAVNSVCDNCSFGKTGFNCEDNYLLIIVIVASALGGLLLISMSVTAYAFLRKGKRKTDKPEEHNMTFPNLGAQKSSSSFPMIPRVGGGGSNDIYGMPKKNTDSTTNMNGYRGNTPTGLGNNSGGVGGLRAQIGPSFNRGANMSYRSNTPTSTDRGRTYEEPKSFGLPRASQGNQPRANPYDRNPYDNHRNPY